MLVLISALYILLCHYFTETSKQKSAKMARQRDDPNDNDFHYDPSYAYVLFKNRYIFLST